MEDFQSSEVTDLQATAFAVGQDNFGFETVDRLLQIPSDLLRDLIFFFLKSIGTAQPAAIRFDVVQLKARDRAEDFNGREANSQGSQMTWGKKEGDVGSETTWGRSTSPSR